MKEYLVMVNVEGHITKTRIEAHNVLMALEELERQDYLVDYVIQIIEV